MNTVLDHRVNLLQPKLEFFYADSPSIAPQKSESNVYIAKLFPHFRHQSTFGTHQPNQHPIPCQCIRRVLRVLEKNSMSVSMYEIEYFLLPLAMIVSTNFSLFSASSFESTIDRKTLFNLVRMKKLILPAVDRVHVDWFSDDNKLNVLFIFFYDVYRQSSLPLEVNFIFTDRWHKYCLRILLCVVLS